MKEELKNKNLKYKQIISIKTEMELNGSNNNKTNYLNDNCDVWVQLDDNTNWVGTCFTYDNIKYLQEKNSKSGECLNGKYFWASNMLIVDSLEKENLKQIITNLLIEGTFDMIFELIKPENGADA